MQLEHHKEIHGHWSDDQYDTEDSDSDQQDNDFVPEYLFEEETVFGPEEEKTLLLCNQI